MPSGSPTIKLVPVSKIVSVNPTASTGRPLTVTVILSKDACQNPCQGDARIRHTLQTFEDPANLIGQGDPGKVFFLIVGVYATKEELGA